MKEVSKKFGGDKATIVKDNVVVMDHVTLHKASDKFYQLRTTFDYTDVPRETILALASETLLIRWRTAFKSADKVDETSDNQTVLVAKMLKGAKPRMSKGEKLTRLLSDMTREEKEAILLQLMESNKGIDIVLQAVNEQEDDDNQGRGLDSI